MQSKHYVHLGIMTVLSFIAMFILMYAMVDSYSNVYSNLNQVYMAGLMTAPMVLIELAVMRSMYSNKTANMAIIVVGILSLAVFFTMIRQQTIITDTQFLRSMIPHHAGAILMCEKAPIQDADIRNLCKTILASQRSEIDRMKAKLQVLEK